MKNLFELTGESMARHVEELKTELAKNYTISDVSMEINVHAHCRIQFAAFDTTKNEWQVSWAETYAEALEGMKTKLTTRADVRRQAKHRIAELQKLL